MRRPIFFSCFHSSPATLASKKSIKQFKLADIGEGITECEVIKWSVEPKSTVQAFDALCEVQSDKASVEITSPYDGVVTQLLVQEGEVAKVGTGLCLIEVEVEEETDSPDAVKKETPVQPAAESSPESCPDAETAMTPRPHPLDPSHPAPKADNFLATPSVRHYARQKGIKLAQVSPGSGRDGRVEKNDIERYLSEQASASPSQSLPGQDAIVELGRTRYGMWKAMVKSLEIPHFGYSTTLDLTALYNLLPILNAHIPEHYKPSPSSLPSPLTVSPSAVYPAPSLPQVAPSQQYTHLTYLPVLLKTLSKSMLEWPLFRSSITPGTSDPGAKPTLTVRPHADVSIALSTPTGLYTPTLHSVDTYNMYGLASTLKRLSHLGRQVPCGLTPKEMPKGGGTLTVSNVGAVGTGEFAAPVLVPGSGVAIVAIGRAKWIWDVDVGDGKGERRLKVGVSWSADHRVVEGAELAAFVECWRGYVEVPERLIADSV
ncbi:CoA-dependent acyltransferase [Guyanagaster necrorhizus]|uniref:Dihydrolipoamide acetyltransferase component of pyruvate dehydrogenase complex n=1 Tax=Guyanagaster necrorhizus TaxID=856835 RepID=A0A9P8AX06_9AGAR|nr:CoA-dependent acyltransferase [Guyanagaster necrorhizus MCA 3950]KAG7450920.1 CoA-dependent acyltransferase [Guyanagaster necrorhizus MCA 3950]